MRCVNGVFDPAVKWNTTLVQYPSDTCRFVWIAIQIYLPWKRMGPQIYKIGAWWRWRGNVIMIGQSRDGSALETHLAPSASEVIERLVEGATEADLARTYGVSQAMISKLQPSPFESAIVVAWKKLARPQRR